MKKVKVIVNPYNHETEPASYKWFEEVKRPMLEQSTPIHEAKETVEEAAKVWAKQHTAKQAPFRTKREKEMYLDGCEVGYVFGTEYRATHPIENKEGVKSAEELVNDFIRRKPRYTKQDVINELQKHIPAQFIPIDQGKRMADIEEIVNMAARYLENGEMVATSSCLEQILCLTNQKS